MIYELSVFTTLFGQQCVNRWNYLLTGDPASVKGSFALIEAFGGIPPTLTPTQFPTGTLMERWQEAAADALQFQSMTCKAIYDVTDFYELPYIPVLDGDQTGDALSPVIAFGFRSSRTRTDIRRGMKRLPGVTEAEVSTGGNLVGGGVSFSNEMAGFMSDVLEYDDEGNTLSFAPIVVKKQAYIPEGSTREAYRYFPTLAEQLENIAVGVLWQPYAQVRTQTSRQYGRGQ